MTKELFQFMVNKNVKEFYNMKQKQGSFVEITFNKMVSNMPPMQIKAKGTLEKVDDFVSAQIGGKVYPFASKEGIIVEIVDDKTKERLYDASLVVNKTTQFTDKTRLALGLPNPDSKYAYVAQKQFNASLNQ